MPDKNIAVAHLGHPESTGGVAVQRGHAGGALRGLFTALGGAPGGARRVGQVSRPSLLWASPAR